MIWLSESQVDTIENTLVQQGVVSPALLDDLLDHTCCMVEEDLNEGTSFDDALNTAIYAFGNKGLALVQHRTNVLVRDTDRSRIGQWFNYFAAAAVLLTAMFFAIGPVLIGIAAGKDWPILFVFLPVAFAGWYALLTRFDYRRFEVRFNQAA